MDDELQPLTEKRCTETGFMDGTGRCCLPFGHSGKHMIDGSDMGDSTAPRREWLEWHYNRIEQ